MVENVNLNSLAFAPVEVAFMGDRDAEVLSEEYSDAAVQGIKGTLLPNSSPGGAGASMGFSAADPIPIIVDPDIPGASYVVHPGTITEKEGEAPRANMPAGGYDRGIVRQIADAAMRKAAGATNAMTGKEEPMAKKGSAAKTPARRKAASKASEVDLTSGVDSAPEGSQPDVNPHIPEERQTTELPTKVITFDFGPPMGSMECRYHDIYREENRLILAWDVGCVAASKYKPAVLNEPIHVIVGKEQTSYKVLSLGIEFTDERTDRFYIILLIDLRTPEAEPPPEGGFMDG